MYFLYNAFWFLYRENFLYNAIWFLYRENSHYNAIWFCIECTLSPVQSDIDKQDVNTKINLSIKIFPFFFLFMSIERFCFCSWGHDMCTLSERQFLISDPSIYIVQVEITIHALLIHEPYFLTLGSNQCFAPASREQRDGVQIPCTIFRSRPGPYRHQDDQRRR